MIIENIIIYAIESGTILLVLYVFYYYFLKNDTAFRFNRYYLLLSQALAVFLPLIAIPTLNFPASVAENTFYFQFPTFEVNAYTGNSSYAPYAMIYLFVVVYFSGFFFQLSKLLLQIIAIRKLLLDKRYKKSLWKGHKIIYTKGEFPTFSFYRTIFFNDKAKLSTAETATILLHESIHIKELHTIDLLLSEIFCIIFWINPVAKMYKRAIMLNHEYLADAKVLTEGQISGVFYKGILARNCLQSSNLNIGTYFFNQSETINRITMMNSEPKRINVLKLMSLGTLACILTFAFSCETHDENIAKESSLESNSYTAIVENEIAPTDEIFSVVESPPSFEEKGNAAFMEYIGRNLKYPAEDIENQKEGKIYVQFVIEKDGAITNVKVVKNNGSDRMADEAIRVIENSPKWEPGRQREMPIRVRMVMPINFTLN